MEDDLMMCENTGASNSFAGSSQAHPSCLKGQAEDSRRKYLAGKIADLNDGFKALENGDDVDTMELEALANECQGPYECAFSFEGNGKDSLEGFKHCKKNPEHKGFMPVTKFITSGVDCLPAGYQKQPVFDFIKCQTALTVKLQIKYVSESRPDLHPRTGCEYMHSGLNPLYRLKIISHGTGMVVDVAKVQGCYTLTVATACHVVFDQSEADKTTVEFTTFCDNDAEKKSSIPAGDHKKITSDVCLISVITHDECLGESLERNLQELKEKREEALEMFNIHKKKPLLPIVSHPHGKEKQVSFGFIQKQIHHKFKKLPNCVYIAGNFVKNFKLFYNANPCGIIYDTATCPGSSGAIFFHKDTFNSCVTCSSHEGCRDGKRGGNISGDNTSLDEHLLYPSGLPTKVEAGGALERLMIDAQSDDVLQSRLKGKSYGKLFENMTKEDDGCENPKEFDEWFEKEWESDPSYVRRIYEILKNSV